jgi:hypothetical protein
MAAKSAPLSNLAMTGRHASFLFLCSGIVACSAVLIGCRGKQPAPETSELFAALACRPFDCEMIASRRTITASNRDCRTWIVITRGSIPDVGNRAKGPQKDAKDAVTISAFPVSAISNLLADFRVAPHTVPGFEEEKGRMVEWKKGTEDIRVRECKVKGPSVMSVIEHCK